MSSKDKKQKDIKNPDAYRNYDILEEIECGIVLKGSEIKSIRSGNTSLKDSYGMIKNSEVYILNMYIKPYENGMFNPEPTRNRKLLLNKREIIKIENLIKQKGLSFIPIKLYFKGSNVKILMGLGKGKKLYDKREDMAKRDVKRKLDRIKKRF